MLIEEGVINGEELNAADYQLAPSIRLLMTFDDLRPTIESRPAGSFAKRVLPGEMGRVHSEPNRITRSLRSRP